VDLIGVVERTMDRVADVHPAVDHLARRSRRGEDDLALLAQDLRAQVSAAAAELFDRWRELRVDFHGAAAQLDQLRDGSRHRRAPAQKADFQTLLNQRINTLRMCRQALEESAGDLRCQLVAELDEVLGRLSVPR
jgi:hypothetical protein